MLWGFLGNCWLVASIAAIVKQPTWIRKLFVEADLVAGAGDPRSGAFELGKSSINGVDFHCHAWLPDGYKYIIYIYIYMCVWIILSEYDIYIERERECSPWYHGLTCSDPYPYPLKMLRCEDFCEETTRVTWRGETLLNSQPVRVGLTSDAYQRL